MTLLVALGAFLVGRAGPTLAREHPDVALTEAAVGAGLAGDG